MTEKYYKLIESREGKESVQIFSSFEALKSELVENAPFYFSFLTDVEKKYSKPIPNFSDCESIEDINFILSDYDFSWYVMKVIEVYG